MPAAPASPIPRRNFVLNLIFAIVGGALLYVTVRRVGWSDVQGSIADVGWWYVVVIALGGLRFAARASAWRECVRPASLPLAEAFGATLAADALGNLTPLGLLASEPTKVILIRQRVPMVQGVAAVAAENAFYAATVLAMISAGALVFFAIAQVPPVLALAAQGVLGAAVVGALVALWVGRQQPAILTRLAQIVSGLTGRAATSVDRLRQVEVHFYALLKWPLARIARVIFWEACFHIGAVLEVYLVLRVIAGGTSLLQAFVLETTGRLIVVVFKFVPYRLGVDEAGTALVARALTLDPAVGVTLALIRRLRILVWNSVGLVYLAFKRSH